MGYLKRVAWNGIQFDFSSSGDRWAGRFGLRGYSQSRLRMLLDLGNPPDSRWFGGAFFDFCPPFTTAPSSVFWRVHILPYAVVCAAGELIFNFKSINQFFYVVASLLG